MFWDPTRNLTQRFSCVCCSGNLEVTKKYKLPFCVSSFLRWRETQSGKKDASFIVTKKIGLKLPKEISAKTKFQVQRWFAIFYVFVWETKTQKVSIYCRRISEGEIVWDWFVTRLEFRSYGENSATEWFDWLLRQWSNLIGRNGTFVWPTPGWNRETSFKDIP